MRNVVCKILMAACVSSVTILSTAKASMAQVNMDFLTEVAESCQKDVFSEEYYQQMGHKAELIPIKQNADHYLSNCIRSRYFYLLVISRLPWLVSTEEMIPGYPGAVAVSQIAYRMSPGSSSIDYPLQYSNFIDCIASKDNNSEECSDESSLGVLYRATSTDIDYTVKFDLFSSDNSDKNSVLYAYLCPSCYVAYNNNPSGKTMVAAYIKWFTKLEPPQRKELTSILDNEQAQSNNNSQGMRDEATDAWNEYTASREKMAEEEKDSRIRKLLDE